MISVNLPRSTHYFDLPCTCMNSSVALVIQFVAVTIHVPLPAPVIPFSRQIIICFISLMNQASLLSLV